MLPVEPHSLWCAAVLPLRVVPRRELTVYQRAGLVGWHLGSGEGLDLAALRALTQLRPRDVHMLLHRARHVAPVRLVDGFWALDFDQPLPLVAARQPQERAFLVAARLARYGAVRTRDVRHTFGMSKQGVYTMLCTLSAVLPLYEDETKPGLWLVCAMREAD